MFCRHGAQDLLAHFWDISCIHKKVLDAKNMDLEAPPEGPAVHLHGDICACLSAIQVQAGVLPIRRANGAKSGACQKNAWGGEWQRMVVNGCEPKCAPKLGVPC
jgi:hypothetical protein